MRTRIGVLLVTVCLGLAGCSLFGKKQSAHQSNPKPFTGSETAAQRETAAAPAARGGPLPGANGYLAGRVIAASTGRPVAAAIQVKDPDDKKAVPFDVVTKEDGYFTIPGLKVGQNYQLIARAKEGGDLISQVLYAQPPRLTLLFEVDKKHTNSDTPPMPDAPKVPGKKGATGPESGHEGTPAASIDRPIKIAPDREPFPRPGEPNPPPANGVGASQGSGNPANISNVAQDFQQAPRPMLDASVPNPQQYRSVQWPAPPEPRWEGIPGGQPPQPAPPVTPSGPSPSAHVPTRPVHVPSCVLIGNKLDNFALKDLDGQTWEYRRNHTGRLVLLDFWYSSCSWCRHAIPHLNELQERYGPFKLEVIGIAAETGAVEQQVRNVGSVRVRYGIKYRTLLSGGGHDDCPVINQFRIQAYPTLILLDETGTIIWRSDDKGMDEYAWKTLDKLIADHLIQRR